MFHFEWSISYGKANTQKNTKQNTKLTESRESARGKSRERKKKPCANLQSSEPQKFKLIISNDLTTNGQNGK